MTTVRRAKATPPSDRDEIVDRLRGDGHTVGRTRAAILDAVLETTHGFTADELAAGLDGVHAATVYRTLGLLEEIGVIRHVHVSHGPAIYELASIAANRQHLACDTCGRHFSVSSRVFDASRRVLERDHDFLLDSGHFAILGTCRSCAAGDHS